MSELAEIRKKLLSLDSFIQENKNTEKRLEVRNMDELKEYYKRVRDHIINELKLSSFETIPRIIKSDKVETEARATLIMDSNYREQNALVTMFNEDLYNGVFNESILQDGIFLPASRSRFIENPPSYLFLDPSTGRKHVGTMYIRFLFDKNALTCNQELDESLRDALKNHIFKTGEFTPTDYGLIKEYFLETAPFVLNCLLLNFKDEYITAKRENLPVILSQAMVNTGTDTRIVIVLEALYNELLKQYIFKNTVFENAVTSVTKGNTKYFNPTLMDPVKQCAPTRQYNLRLILNTAKVEDIPSNSLCYNSRR